MPRNLFLAIGVIFFGIIAFDMMGILVRLLGGFPARSWRASLSERIRAVGLI